MKTKLLTLLTLALTAGSLMACGTTDKGDSKGKSDTPSAATSEESKHTHKYNTVVEEECVPATCTTDGKEVKACECGEKKTTTIPATGHTYVDGTKTGVVTPETCKCGLTTYRMDVADATGWNQPTVKMNGKTAPNNEANWDITGKIPAGKYDIVASVKSSYDSHADRYWYNMAKHGNETATSSPDTEAEDDFRYFFKIGDTVKNPTNEKNWGEDGINASSYTAVVVTSGVDFAGTETSFSLMHGNIGYSLIIEFVRLVPVAAK